MSERIPMKYDGHTEGPLSPGCFVDKESQCQCRYMIDDSYARGIAEIFVDNGKKIKDGGNDCPPLDEAIANAHLFSAAPDAVKLVEELAEALNKVPIAELIEAKRPAPGEEGITEWACPGCGAEGQEDCKKDCYVPLVEAALASHQAFVQRFRKEGGEGKDA